MAHNFKAAKAMAFLERLEARWDPQAVRAREKAKKESAFRKQMRKENQMYHAAMVAAGDANIAARAANQQAHLLQQAKNEYYRNLTAKPVPVAVAVPAAILRILQPKAKPPKKRSTYKATSPWVRAKNNAMMNAFKSGGKLDATKGGSRHYKRASASQLENKRWMENWVKGRMQTYFDELAADAAVMDPMSGPPAGRGTRRSRDDDEEEDVHGGGDAAGNVPLRINFGTPTPNKHTRFPENTR